MTETKPSPSCPPKPSPKLYAATFCGGFTACLAGEFTVRLLRNEISPDLIRPELLDKCLVSGVQKVAKDLSGELIKRTRFYPKMTPFMFGAATGVPMWAIAKVFSVPIQNNRRRSQQQTTTQNNDKTNSSLTCQNPQKNSNGASQIGPMIDHFLGSYLASNDNDIFQGYFSAFRNDVFYHTLNNGISQHFAQRVFPNFQFSSITSRRAVEAMCAGCIGASCFLLSWPVKSALTGQTVSDAALAGICAFPRIAAKKMTYSCVKPQLVRALNVV
ncbi:hypothetical protein TRFO_19999 [Tritrichomonas foetus]|uniref:Mitochondrial carrier protein n=1 Tax=Tritrichomonas foetus TaxID=1144522 RepID=A0A1J4KLM9_9EUKA|nr:hypothetical protein TRFO_19999 [Tritrichomonas foetus]|eukprot:OHT10598.1 hypothetical protein TRFO_19999 [Tritrichomonas foetus]